MEKNTIQSDVIRGNINTIILKALYGGERYGYDIIKEINEATSGQYDLKQPTLYSCLTRLEGQGFIESYWGSKSNGGRRKYYSLTDLGREVFLKSQSDWEFSRTVMDRLISNKTVDLDAMSKQQDGDGSANIEDCKDGEAEADEKGQELENSSALEGAQLINNEASITKDENAIDDKNLGVIDNKVACEHVFADTSAIMNKLFNQELNESSAVSYAEKVIAEKFVADRTKSTATIAPTADYFKDFYDESDNTKLVNEDKTELSQDIVDNAKKALNDNAELIFEESTAKISTNKQQTEQEKQIAEKEHFMNYNDHVAKMETAATGIFAREYRNILGYFANSCFVEQPKPIASVVTQENVNNNSTSVNEDVSQNIGAQLDSISDSKTIEANDDLKESMSAYTTNNEVNKKFAKMASDVRELGDNIKIRTAVNDTSKEYTKMFHFYSNKLMLKHYAILFGIMLAEILFTSVVVFLGLKINHKGDVYYYVGAVVLAVLFPFVAFIKNYSQPNKTKRINFNLKNALFYRTIVMLQCFLIIYCYNLFFNMPLTFSMDYITTLLLPALLCTNFPISALIFNGLFKSKKYAVD